MMSAFGQNQMRMDSTSFSDDKFHDECGVFAISHHPEAARMTYLGLYALQHRGQESAGIVTVNGGKLHQRQGMGYVADVFSDDELNSLTGTAAIGHVRYSTTGESRLANAPAHPHKLAPRPDGPGPQW